MAIAEEQDFYAGEASRLRVALSEEKLQQLANSAGAYDSETYIVQYLNEERRPYIIRIAGDKTVARRVFHEAILSEMSFMTIPFGFYAATAGVRNVSDLARVSYSKLCAVLNILEKSVRLPKDIYFEKPTNEEILNILNQAGQVIAATTSHYTLIAENDPEPTYLFDDSGSVKTDTEILREGLLFLQNIELRLPLPRTISGTVYMKNLGEPDAKAVPMPGYSVQLVGISSPAQDKVEDDEDLIGYTDSDGKFIIVMPDRYNLMETVKVIISKKQSYGVVQSRTVADAVPHMTFIRRASEILDSEYVTIKIPKKDGTVEIRHERASALLDTYTKVDRMVRENLRFETSIRYKITIEQRKAKRAQEIRRKKYALYFRYKLMKERLNRGIFELDKEAEELYDQERVVIDQLIDAIRPRIEEKLVQILNRIAAIKIEIEGDSEGRDANKTGSRELKNELKKKEKEKTQTENDKKRIDSTDIRAELEHPNASQPLMSYIKDTDEEMYGRDEYTRLENLLADIAANKKILEADIAEIELEMGNLEQPYKPDGFMDLEKAEAKKVYHDYYLDISRDATDILLQYLVSSNRNIIDIAEKIRLELLMLEAQEEKNEQSEVQLAEIDALESYIETHPDDPDVIKYTDNKKTIEYELEFIYGADPRTDDLERTLMNLINGSLDANLGKFMLIRDMFDGSSLKPRALPSVRLMGEGSTAVNLPTDTAPSRMFNYSMVQRLVEPAFAKDARLSKGTRTRLNKMLDPDEFKRSFYENPDSVPVAVSLGMGYILNMHQAWVPDGFALGNLLYSLILAPGEEQRIIVQEHIQSYTVSDEAAALDTVSDTYTNTQRDNETAAFNNAAERYSGAHSDYEYYSEASSKGEAGLGIKAFFGLSAGVKSKSVNKGSGSSNAYQTDTYNEASQAAQNFQTEIKTEAERIAAAQRTSIRTATSKETESVSSRIIANHNHSHVMTVQYWEVMRRYRMETCIEGVELVLFVPLKPVRFLPDESGTQNQIKFSNYNLEINDIYDFKKEYFDFRYGKLLRHADILTPRLPVKYRSGLNLIRKFAAYPVWIKEEKAGNANKTVTLTLKGSFLEFDNIEATLYFANSNVKVRGMVTDREYFPIDPSLNTRDEVIYGIQGLRNDNQVSRRKGFLNMKGLFEAKDVSKEPKIWKFSFSIPATVTAQDISYIRVENNISSWSCRLSQENQYLAPYEIAAIANYEDKLIDLYKDDTKSGKDQRRIAHYEEGLPECYITPNITFTRNELLGLGPLRVQAEITDPNNNTDPTTETPITLQYGGFDIDLSNRPPVLHYTEVLEMEETLHHVLSNTMHYSQVIWSSLSDDERIMMLEPYTVGMDYDLYGEFDTEKTEEDIDKIPLLNCVNAKRVIGFYGNCMLLPFTYPQKLAEALGKTAGEIQEELYRYHTTSFRVPSTVISVPTQGMVGEAVLGATNVSEKIDITRFWNWKDSEIDHMNIDQTSFNGNSLLATATTRDIDAPTQGAAATAHIDSSSLLSALTQRAAPTFANALANTDIRDLLKSTDSNASAGRDKVVDSTSGMINKALDAAAQVASAYLGGKTGKSNTASGQNNNNTQLKPAEGGDGNSSESGDGNGNGSEGSNDSSGKPKPKPGDGGTEETHSGAEGKPPDHNITEEGGPKNPSKESLQEKPGENDPKTNDPETKDSETNDPNNPGQDETDDDPFGVHGIFDKALELSEQGISGVEYFNREMEKLTGEYGNYQEGEIEAFLRDFCEANGADYDDIVASVEEIFAKAAADRS